MQKLTIFRTGLEVHRLARIGEYLFRLGQKKAVFELEKFEKDRKIGNNQN